MGAPFFHSPVQDLVDHKIAAAYNEAGEQYLAYADGAAGDLFAFDGDYAYGDRESWALLVAKLKALRAAGRTELGLLDLGCGPGTWIRRLVIEARRLGFSRVRARGIDLAEGQIAHARKSCSALARLPGVTLHFEPGDIRAPFSEKDGSVDLCLCLYGVLNHLSVRDMGAVLREAARVTGGWFIATVRATGSTPTIYVDSLQAARGFRQDNHFDRMDVELANGRHISFASHLFSSAELRDLASGAFAIEDLRGLDLFHLRFALDARFNPTERVRADGLLPELDRLEEACCRHPGMIDFATHLLLVAKPRTEG
ncbi:MAG: class I SAM-dependent methyltransferase [Rhizomicrobium sp.]|nr:class I SAM-dependent methyltransferase [Rhizomicrobium sp.]